MKTVNNRLAVLSTLIKYVKGELSRLRFKLDGMAGELQALPPADAETLLSSTTDIQRPPKPLHCLRHTFGTVMAKRVPLPVLQKLMGHADVKTTLRYVDVDEAAKRAAIAAVFGHPESERGGELP